MNQPTFAFNELDAGLGAALVGLALVLAVMVTMAVLAARAMRRQNEESARAAAAQVRQNEAMERRLGELGLGLTIRLVIARPSPRPWRLVVMKSSKMAESRSAGMPDPVSVTEISTCAP